MFKCEQTIISS